MAAPIDRLDIHDVPIPFGTIIAPRASVGNQVLRWVEGLVQVKCVAVGEVVKK